MKIIEPSYEILDIFPKTPLSLIEIAGRTCYKSEDKISLGTDIKFSEMIKSKGHYPMIEFGMMAVRFICDRGVSHELVRHRLPSFAQESTRYCNYSKDKFGNEITVIRPCFWIEECWAYEEWKLSCEESERTYFKLIEMRAKPEEARSVLPNSLKTEIVIFANFREWHHIFMMRTSKMAHPQMRQLMVPLLDETKSKIPVIFNDIITEE